MRFKFLLFVTVASVEGISYPKFDPERVLAVLSEGTSVNLLFEFVIFIRDISDSELIMRYLVEDELFDAPTLSGWVF